MSLSQKHSGKVLVPWFNTAEWKGVYNLIYSDTTRNWAKALQIIEIWKIRTPLLSAGVEGTFIILQALCVEPHKLSEYEVTHIYSTAIIRFLNLCAANSDKQGTFYKVAMKNKIPKWLITVRHEIAHSHKVPSKYMLELSVNFCLEWLKEQYWDVQASLMTDFVVEKSTNELLDDAVFIYVNSSLFNQTNFSQDREMTNRIRSLQKKLHKKFNGNCERILESCENVLADAFDTDRDNVVKSICRILVDEGLMLSVECDIDSNGRKIIPKSFIKSWTKPLNILHSNNALLDLLEELLTVVTDEGQDNMLREVATLWLREIFLGLLKQKLNNKNTEGVIFNSSTTCKCNKFLSRVLEEVTPWTLNFIKEVLEYHGAPGSFLEDAIQAISAYTIVQEAPNGRIYTIDDLDFNTSEYDAEPAHKNNISEQSEQRVGWASIEDTTPFTNLPLGILPNQRRDQNPFFHFET